MVVPIFALLALFTAIYANYTTRHVMVLSIAVILLSLALLLPVVIRA
jgi:hypothetical protein